VVIWIGWLTWATGALIGVIIAWGGRRPVILEFFEKLNSPFAVGNLRFQLTGFVYASLILLMTHGVSRIWRFIFKNKILARTGLESGLQESITTIAVYILWILGILIALHVFGLNTTSLAVAFGALGIGLGFGLQNIFNNFISGVILLFERPIQVGDAIEINGTWASVKKINVRSTVVQTWDNASLIIPNSEFISKEVINWSFKDMRLRRNINVGVAYGSDVELVRTSLMEVAENTRQVLKYPKPNVLFTDFGDSALIFRLRVWTLIDYMLEVETAIRFEIDRLFRERGIVIAFPQQDIHLKTVDAIFPLDIQQKAGNSKGSADDDE
jgi:potassium efflux system protein